MAMFQHQPTVPENNGEINRCKKREYKVKRKGKIKKHIECKHTSYLNNIDPESADGATIPGKVHKGLHNVFETSKYLECKKCEYRYKRKKNIQKHNKCKHTSYLNNVDPESADGATIPGNNCKWQERQECKQI